MRAIRRITKVQPSGTVHLDSLPFREGENVEVILLPVEEGMEDQARASETALSFWDNDVDDRVWNDALPPA